MPVTAIKWVLLYLASKLACLDTLITPPIVLEPKSNASGPRIILTLLKEAISKLIAWSIEVFERSPIDIPSSVSKNLSPEYPRRTGWVAAWPMDRIASPVSSLIDKARVDLRFVWYWSPEITIFDPKSFGWISWWASTSIWSNYIVSLIINIY